MTTIILFVALLGLLIMVHEAGHFLVARWHGITAHEFGFGFPPRLVGFARREDGRWDVVGRTQKREYSGTIYSLNWLPFGGFVRIKGEDGADRSPDSFGSRGAWVRFQVLVAGVAMNLLLAWVLFSASLMLGIPSQVADDVPGEVRVSRVLPDGAAAAMGMRAGDRIVRLCDAASVCADAARVTDVQAFARANAGRAVTVTVGRGGGSASLSGTLGADTGRALGIGLESTQIVRYGLVAAVREGAMETVRFTSMVFRGLYDLVRGAAPEGGVAGPVGIAVMTGQMAELGAGFLARFAAVLSVNLAVINILPIPALDGGRILFLVIEKLRRGRGVDRRIEGIVHGVSFAVLIALMAWVTVRDVLHFL